jgi:16S rRNA (uracil1498-N3)-methyltransferase
MIEKATELGVAEIIPIEAVRSDKGLEKAAQKRLERWRRIALEASQQARRAFLPLVSEPIAFDDILNRQFSYRYSLDEGGGKPLAGALPVARHATDRVAVLVGPEGGWTDEERAAFLNAGWTQITLGPLILRAETAALAALAVIQAGWQVVPDTLEH